MSAGKTLLERFVSLDADETRYVLGWLLTTVPDDELEELLAKAEIYSLERRLVKS